MQPLFFAAFKDLAYIPAMAKTAEKRAPNAPDLSALRSRATEIRRLIVEMLAEAGSGHPGGSLSAVEVVTALYFGGLLRYDAANPEWRDLAAEENFFDPPGRPAT